MKTSLLFLLCCLSGSAQTTITFPNAGVYLSPYNWRTAAGAAICPIGGCYMKFVLTTGSGCGSSCVLTFSVDTTINSGLSDPTDDLPAVKSHCDSPTVPGTWVTSAWPNNNTNGTPVSLYSNLAASTAYTCFISLWGGGSNDGNGWTGTTFQTKINSLTLDTGATVALPAIRPKSCLFFGASYELGSFGAPVTGLYRSYVDPEQTWAGGLAQTTVLNCEYGLVGVGSQGFQNSGNGGYPVFSSSWNNYDSTHAKTFSPGPDYVIVHQAENDISFSSGTETTLVTSWIAAARSAFGSGAYIFMIGGLGSKVVSINSAIQAGVVAAADTAAFYVPVGTQYQLTTFSAGCTAVSGSSWASPDCLHVTSTYQNQIYGNTLTAFIMKTLFLRGISPIYGGSFIN